MSQQYLDLRLEAPSPAELPAHGVSFTCSALRRLADVRFAELAPETPTTTHPVAIQVRISGELFDLIALAAPIRSSPARTARSGVVLMRPRIAEVHYTSTLSPMYLATNPAKRRTVSARHSQ
jgi:hypothetical protein